MNIVQEVQFLCIISYPVEKHAQSRSTFLAGHSLLCFRSVDGVQCAALSQSCLTLHDPWTVAHQAPLSLGLSRKKHWNGLPFPSSGYLPDPGVQPGSSALQVDSLQDFYLRGNKGFQPALSLRQ